MQSCHGEDLHIFFHPDLWEPKLTVTVGPGVSPGQLLSQVADFTASGEFHPALKTSYSITSLLLLYTLRQKLQDQKLKHMFYFPLDCGSEQDYNKENGGKEILP